MNEMKVATAGLYRCHSCEALNVASDNVWCLCAGSEQTLVCVACSACFCHAGESWKYEFWAKATADLHTRRRTERSSGVKLQLTRQEPSRPVILLIDDDRSVHAIVSRVLEGFGGTLLHAYDGEAGLRMAQEVQPELVIADALLPKLDGREIARTLKSDVKTAMGRVVVITSLYKGARYRKEAIEKYLADDYMEKPIRADKLRTMIENMIGKNKMGSPQMQVSR